MRLIILLAVGVFSLAAASTALAWPSPHTLGPYAYVSPAPGSTLHMPGTTIIVRPGGWVDASSLTAGVIQAVGSASGSHDGFVRLSDDGKTVVFHPDAAFEMGETVTCTIEAGIRTDSEGQLPEASFSFRIFDDSTPGPAPGAALAMEAPEWLPARAPGSTSSSFDSLPPDFPPIQVTVGSPPGSEAMFLCPLKFNDPTYQSYLMILANDGTPVSQRKLQSTGLDFKMQPMGRMSYFDTAAGKYYLMNANFAVVDSFAMGYGYYTDVHELQILPDGHALLMAYDGRAIDMSAIVPGGNPNAVVTGLVIHELDRSKDVVFEWRSWDHFQITDAVNRSLTTAQVDYAHGNAIERDTDGHLLISSRHMSEITKISRDDGHILWRLGGKNNEFSFVNDPDGFSYQHSVRRLPNGHIILYDNGNFHTPSRSRAVEYDVNEAAKTATLVWEYRNSPDYYGSAMGSVQRLPNGNTVIGWGATSPALTEVTPAGEKVEEIRFPDGVFSYRGFRHPWPPTIAVHAVWARPRVDVGSIGPEITLRLWPTDQLFWSADSIDVDSLRIQGTIAATSGVFVFNPSPRMEARFPSAPLLAYLKPGRTTLQIDGAFVSGERFHTSADIEITGEKRVQARMASPVGSSPLRISFRSDGATPRTVTMAAYDAHGRRVRRWTATISGSGEVTWDGRGGNGEKLASGIYFVGTEGTAINEMARVVLVK